MSPQRRWTARGYDGRLSRHTGPVEVSLGARSRWLPLVGWLLVLLLAGCGGAPGDGAEEPRAAPLPDELVAHFDQSRMQRVGREVFVRLVHEGEGTVTVTRAEIGSDRFPTVTWSGEKTFVNEADLEFDLPRAGCGRGSAADVRLTYRLDGGPEQVSVTRAADRYGAVGLLLDRDCAEETLAQAATLEVGEPQVVGEGRSSRFRLPVTLRATGERPEVRFEGFEGTVLFTVTEPRRLYPRARAVAMTTGTEYDVVLAVAPTRCDPHALAEDKVGTLFPMHVGAPVLSRHAAFYLPLSDETRADLRGFFGPHCGL
jgi:hypothetical protein